MKIITDCCEAAEGCNKRFDYFLVYTFHFNDVKRPKISKRLSILPSTTENYHFEIK